MRLSRTTFVASAAAAALPRPALADADLIALQIGAMPIEGAAEAYYAEQRGFFKAAGLDAKLTVLNSGSAIVPAVMAGTLDVGFASPSPLIAARLRGLPVRYLQYAPIYVGGPPISAFMVAKDAPFKTAADLNGRIVGVAALRDIGEYQVRAWIEKNGGDASTIQWVEVPYVQMGAALAAGRIAGAGSTEPYVTAAKPLARIFGNMNEAASPPYLMAGWFATESWLAKNADTAKRFCSAMQQTARWANGHTKDSGTLLVRYTKLEPDIVAAMARDTFDENDRPDPRLVAPVIDVLQKYGKLGPFAATDLLWTR